MFLFKSKKYDEILPPPQPMDMEPGEKPKLFDDVIKPKKAENFPEQEEFSKLVKEIQESSAPKRQIKKGKVSVKAIKSVQQKIPVKQIKGKKLPFKKPKIAKKAEAIGLDKDFDLKGIDFELPKELELSEKDIGLPETLEDFDIENFGKELWQEAEKPRKLFAKRKKEGEMPERQMELPSDKISAIHGNVNEARQALMEFDLEKARKSYIEAMNLYNRINPEEQAKVYHDIKEIYLERKSAEGLKV